MSDITNDSPNEITSPKIETPQIQKPKMGDEAAREQVEAPENGDIAAVADNNSIVSREPIIPTIPKHRDEVAHDSLTATDTAAAIDADTLKTAPAQTPHSVAHPAASRIVSHEELAKAEKAIATFLASKLDPKLTAGLILTLSADIHKGNADKTDFSLILKGPEVAANVAELHKEVMAALPALAPHQAHKDTVGQDTAFRLTMSVPTEEYVKLVETLAAPGAAILSTHAATHADVEADVPSTKKEEAKTHDAAEETAAIVAEADAETHAAAAPAEKQESVKQEPIAEAAAEADMLAATQIKTPAETHGKVAKLAPEQQLAMGA